MLQDQGYGIRVLTLVLLFAAMGQSWNIVGGLANQISLGHAAFFGLGAYTSTLLLMRYGISPWAGILAAMAVAGVAGALLSLPTMRLRGHYFALATLAFGEVLRAIANTWASVTGGPVGLSIPFSEGLAQMQFKSSIPYYYLMLGAAVAVSVVFALISRSRLGYRLRAVKADPQAAEVIGVDTARTRILAAAISAALMECLRHALCPVHLLLRSGYGVLAGRHLGAGGADMHRRRRGDRGRTAGGALLIIPLEELFNDWLSGAAAGVPQLAFGLILIVIILIEPRGLAALWARLRNPSGGNHA